MELLGWLRENGVEIIRLRESIDQDSAMGRAMLHLTIVFAEIERDLAGGQTLAAEIQNMRQRDGLSWGRINTITGLPPSSIRRTCTWEFEEIEPTAFGEG